MHLTLILNNPKVEKEVTGLEKMKQDEELGRKKEEVKRIETCNTSPLKWYKEIHSRPCVY